MTRADEAPSAWSLWRPIVLDLTLPFVSYALVAALGNGALWAMTAAGAASAVSTLINSVRKRALDALGLLVMLELSVAVAISAFVPDPRLLLIRPSLYTAVGAVYAMTSALLGRPLSFAGSRPMVARGGTARLAAVDRVWERSAAFRRSHQAVTFGIGICLAIDSVARGLVVYGVDLERSIWLSKVPHLVAVLLMIVLSALAGRRWARYVDDELLREAADQRGREVSTASPAGSAPFR